MQNGTDCRNHKYETTSCPVAMDIALMAFGFSFTELASVESGRCIRQ